jgi:hypothetical protein
MLCVCLPDTWVDASVGSIEAYLKIHHNVSLTLSREELRQGCYNLTGDVGLGFQYLSIHGIAVEHVQSKVRCLSNA